MQAEAPMLKRCARALAERADLLGIAGGFLAALCCLGVPAVLSFVGAIGGGFLVNDRVLLPLVVGMLGLALFGLDRGRRPHGRTTPVAFGWAGAFLLVTGLRLGGGVVAAGTLLMLVASVLNVRARQATTEIGTRAAT